MLFKVGYRPVTPISLFTAGLQKDRPYKSTVTHSTLVSGPDLLGGDGSALTSVVVKPRLVTDYVRGSTAVMCLRTNACTTQLEGLTQSKTQSVPRTRSTNTT